MFEPLTPQNALACYAIHAEVQYKPWSKAVFMDCLSPPYFAFQYLKSQQLQGYYVAMQVLDEVTLMDIAVSPRLQGLGIGRHILTSFIEQCHVRQAADIWLEVRESNAAAKQLYTSAGFTVIEKRKAYYQTDSGNEAAIIMKLNLSDNLN
ncbi:ribosomal protein S18-alanine N-acetyltransferase [Flavobacterium sp. W21_SRS_FM6]|uniref:ribosomal protein S18-alanine N-acetyltransferase n=1 Tax=Flavobacterium sp. W21_SRS_FM6 TaxID=3240268 RepID=UPI003F92006E